jgi:uncharacterized protein (DUF1810 family)
MIGKLPPRVAARLAGLERFRRPQRREQTRITWELVVGKKETHWMWFVFPQLPGLGRSRTSAYYALTAGEAARYARDDELGKRLRIWTSMVVSHMLDGRSATHIFGEVDAQKFQSSMELFYVVTGEDLFRRAHLLAHDRDFWTLPMPGEEVKHGQETAGADGHHRGR